MKREEKRAFTRKREEKRSHKKKEKRPFTWKRRRKRSLHLEATEILISLSGVVFQLRLLYLCGFAYSR